jgi:hypothetical protein
MLTIYPQAVWGDISLIHLFWIEEPNFPNHSLYHSYAYTNVPGDTPGGTQPFDPSGRLVFSGAWVCKSHRVRVLHLIDLRAIGCIRRTDLSVCVR